MTSVLPERGSRRHPLLFVHGAWHGAWCWERFLPWFVERGWECHAVDLRGHGDSPNDRSLRCTRIADYAEDVGTAIARLDRPPIVVAHSMGTLAVQRHLEGKTLPGAVLVAPIPLGGIWRTVLRVARRHPIAFLKANLTLDLKPLVADRRVAADLLFGADIDPGEADAVCRRLQGESYRAFLDMLLLVRARPPLIPTPVAIVTGSADRIFPIGDVRRTARAYGTDPAVIPGGAHDLMLGPHWEETARAVEMVADGL